MHRITRTLANRIINPLRYRRIRILLRNKNVFIEKGVQFNENTKFENHIKIYAGAQLKNSKVGKGTYIGYNSVFNNCCIGAFCSVASSAKIIYGKHPSSIFISSHPSFFSTNRQAGFSFTDKKLFVENSYIIPDKSISVLIGNDVWIGFGALIMEGVRIGDGAIIGAGAIVTKDVPPYAIVVGSPARIIKYRFSNSEIEKLTRLKWWDKDFKWIQKNYEHFRNINNLDKLLELANAKD